MQHLKLFSAIVLSSFLLYSCSGNTNTSAAKDESSASSAISSVASSATGDASFSCMLDGKTFSESGSNGDINAAFHYKDNANKEQIFFMLSDVNDPSQKLTFEVPDKTGVTTIQNLPPHFSLEGLVLKGFVAYIDDPVTVDVTSITPSGVAGTFSGKYTLEYKSAGNNAKQAIEVTDGKFDIPFSTNAYWKKIYHAE